MLKDKLKKMQEQMKHKFGKKSKTDLIIEKITETKEVPKGRFNADKKVEDQIWEWLNIK